MGVRERTGWQPVLRVTTISFMNEEIEQLRGGGEAALAEVFEKYRGPLERMIEFDSTIACVAASTQRMCCRRPISKWLVACQSTWPRPGIGFHLDATANLPGSHRSSASAFRQKRDPRYEVTHAMSPDPNATSLSILSAFAEQMTSPSQALMREEELQQLRQMLEGMDERSIAKY